MKTTSIFESWYLDSVQWTAKVHIDQFGGIFIFHESISISLIFRKIPMTPHHANVSMMVLTIVFCIQKNSASVQLHVPLSVMIIFKVTMMIKSKSFLWEHFPGIRHTLPSILDKLKTLIFSRLITPIPGYDDDEESRREGVKTAMDFDSDEVSLKSKLVL